MVRGFIMGDRIEQPVSTCRPIYLRPEQRGLCGTTTNKTG